MISPKTKSALINVISCTVSAVLLVLLAINLDKPQFEGQTNLPSAEVTNSTVKIETSIYTKPVPVATEAIISYMNSAEPETVLDVLSAFGGIKAGLNYGIPWKFTYQVRGLPIGLEVKSAKLLLSQSENLKNAKEYELDITDYEFSVYNLLPETKYYYRLNLTLSDGTNVGSVGEFETAKSPRILNIEGAVNVRDIGGHETTDGKKIKYGLLYRGSEIDGKVEPTYCVTEKGKTQMLEDLKIALDMDLRRDDTDTDGIGALGESVKHKYYAASNYSLFLEEKHNEKTRELFKDLADEDNYPIYVHCTYGRDRTGTLIYMLQALLGVDDQTLYKEYSVSAFTDAYLETEKFEVFLAEIAQMEGNSTQEKVENWLISVGVKKEEIAKIKEIFLED